MSQLAALYQRDHIIEDLKAEIATLKVQNEKYREALRDIAYDDSDHKEVRACCKYQDMAMKALLGGSDGSGG